MTVSIIALSLCAAALALPAGAAAIRAGNRRLAATRGALAADREALRTLDRRRREAACALRLAEDRLAALDGWVAEAQAMVRTLEQRLYGTQQVPVERFHIFDRMGAQPGPIWSVMVRRHPDASPADPRLDAAWRTPRTYLIVAGSACEAVDRAKRRFPRDDGFAVGPASMCTLVGYGDQDSPAAGRTGPDPACGGEPPHGPERKSA